MKTLSSFVLVFLLPLTASAQTPPPFQPKRQLELPAGRTGLFRPRPVEQFIPIDPEAPTIFAHHFGSERVVYEAISGTEHWKFYVFICRDGIERLDAVTVFESRQYGFIGERNTTFFLNAEDNSETSRLVDLKDGNGRVSVDGYNVTKNNRLAHRIHEIYNLFRFGGGFRA